MPGPRHARAAPERGIGSSMASRSDASIVAKEELESLKPGRAVYERRGPSIFFLSNREAALKNVEAEQAADAAAQEAEAREPTRTFER